MLNTKQTLKNLHKKFPMMSLDELFEVLDCYVEESYFKTTPGTWEDRTITYPKVWYDTNITSVINRPLTSEVTTKDNTSNHLRAYNAHSITDHISGE